MAKELPGFYFDPEKNRYFPIPKKGAAAGRGIPADGKRPQATPKSTPGAGPSRDETPILQPSQFQLLQKRERFGPRLSCTGGYTGRQFTSASWEADLRQYALWGFGPRSRVDDVATASGPFLHLSLGFKSVLLAGCENGLNTLELQPASRTHARPLSIPTVRIFDSLAGPSIEPAEGDVGPERLGRYSPANTPAPGNDSRASPSEVGAGPQQTEDSSSGSSDSDDSESPGFQRRKRRAWLTRKRRRKARGVWRDTGQGLQRIDIPTEARVGVGRRESPKDPEKPTEQEEQEATCPVTLTLLDNLNLQSRVTALGAAEASPDRSGSQLILATALGSNTQAGSVVLLRNRTGDARPGLEVTRRKYFPKESVWTGEISSNGQQAVVGTSRLGFRIHLETFSVRPLAPSNGSATLAQQIDGTGNLVLSGFRNGAISTVDLRMPPPPLRSLGGFTKLQKGAQIASHTNPLRMDSAICDLKLLRTDENYLLASAMDGGLVQWDCRAVRRPVRSFAGHRNSHTMLKMAVDREERVLISGGEDCLVRLWSLATGALFQQMGPFDSPVSWSEWLPANLALSASYSWASITSLSSSLTWGVWMGAQSSSTCSILGMRSMIRL